MDISNLIQNIDNLNAMTLRELKNMTERFPFYHLARLLYVVNLYKMHEPNLSEELTKASILLPDRTVLFNMIEGKNYQFERGDESKVLVEKDENRTVALIDRFLENINDDTDNESRKEARMMPTIAELTNDYASFLQMKDDSSLEETDDINSSLSQDSLIDSFIQEIMNG